MVHEAGLLMRGLAEIAETSDLDSLRTVIGMQKELRLKRKITTNQPSPFGG